MREQNMGGMSGLKNLIDAAAKAVQLVRADPPVARFAALDPAAVTHSRRTEVVPSTGAGEHEAQSAIHCATAAGIRMLPGCGLSQKEEPNHVLST